LLTAHERIQIGQNCVECVLDSSLKIGGICLSLNGEMSLKVFLFWISSLDWYSVLGEQGSLISDH